MVNIDFFHLIESILKMTTMMIFVDVSNFLNDDDDLRNKFLMDLIVDAFSTNDDYYDDHCLYYDVYVFYFLVQNRVHLIVMVHQMYDDVVENLNNVDLVLIHVENVSMIDAENFDYSVKSMKDCKDMNR